MVQMESLTQGELAEHSAGFERMNAKRPDQGRFAFPQWGIWPGGLLACQMQAMGL